MQTLLKDMADIIYAYIQRIYLKTYNSLEV